MPFKHYAARRHRIPRARYRVLNWPAYEAGLRRRGDPTFWLDEAAIAGWHAPRRTTPGGQPLYSDVAVELVPTLRLLGLALSVPDQTTLSRRGRGFAGRQSRTARHDRPVHLVLDSTGLQLFGQGGWDAAKHGRARRRRRKLHLAVVAGTGEVAAQVLTDSDAADTTQAPDLLRQVEGRLASVTANGAYDGEPVDRASAARQRHPPPDVVVPPRASSRPSGSDRKDQTARDRHVRLLAEKSRMAWQRLTGYGRRNQAETAVGRCKGLIGPRLRARSLPAQQGEMVLAVAVLNRMIRVAEPVTVRHN